MESRLHPAGNSGSESPPDPRIKRVLEIAMRCARTAQDGCRCIQRVMRVSMQVQRVAVDSRCW